MINLKVREAKSILQKILGLIGKTTPEAILINTRFGIHTFGMRFPIDVVILSHNYQVIQTKINLHPNKFFFWNPVYNIVLELPTGTMIGKRIIRGSKIKIILNDSPLSKLQGIYLSSPT